MFKLNILRLTGLNIVAGFLVGKAVASVCSAVCPERLLLWVCVWSVVLGVKRDKNKVLFTAAKYYDLTKEFKYLK